MGRAIEFGLQAQSLGVLVVIGHWNCKTFGHPFKIDC